jgi:hypothetical protein
MIDNHEIVTKLGPGVCSKLRTKTIYLNVDYRGAADEPGCGGTAAFWCLKTFECLGPDDLPVNPQDCRSGRGCAIVLPEI